MLVTFHISEADASLQRAFAFEANNVRITPLRGSDTLTVNMDLVNVGCVKRLSAFVRSWPFASPRLTIGTATFHVHRPATDRETVPFQLRDTASQGRSADWTLLPR